MKRFLIIAIFITTSQAVFADYRPLKLYEMIIKAEKIVYGTIINLDSTHFTLQIEGSLTSDTGTIRVARFEDWVCASRWTRYKIGQQIFLFLTSWNGELISMSGGNEGELPLNKDSIYIHGFTITIPPPPLPQGNTLKDDLIYFETGHFNVYGADYYGIKRDLSSFISDVKSIRDCFDFNYGQYHRITDWKIKCSDTLIEKKLAESKLVNWVYAESIRKNER